MGFECEYEHAGIRCKGYVALPKNTESPQPLVLIAHDWSGRNEFACQKAEALAKLGYVGFAMDLYGETQVGQNNEEKNAFMQPLIQDREFLQMRVQAALHAACALPQVDKYKIAAIGFCFGGLVVLDLARSGCDILGVVSFHGSLISPPPALQKTVKASVLILHGDADPMVPPDAARHYLDELTQAKADWQMHSYGNTLHAFTNPLANDVSFGTVFHARSNQRAMKAMENFLSEIFHV